MLSPSIRSKSANPLSHFSENWEILISVGEIKSSVLKNDSNAIDSAT